MKLLLSLVERSLAPSASAAARALVPSLFRGRASYVTTCGACGAPSAASAHRVDWYELELNVKGVAPCGLSASLADYLQEEQLTGDNRYVCDAAACAGQRRDATRAVRLREAPPVLNLQLKRFVFDMKVRCVRETGRPGDREMRGADVAPAVLPACLPRHRRRTLAKR
jgi:ubiquitin C-terminal hydrolase